MDVPVICQFCCGSSTNQLNGWLKSNLSYWVTVGAGELEGGEDTVGVFSGDSGAGESGDGNELGAEGFLQRKVERRYFPYL